METVKIAAVAALVSASGLAFAHGEEGDVGFALVNGQLLTVLAVDDEGDTQAAFPDGFDSLRVFAAETDANGFADEPGFYINSFSGIAANTQLSYTNVGPLLEWDGTSFVATDHQLDQIVIPNIQQTTTPLSGSSAGFGFDYNGGEFDQHPDLQLTNSSGPIEAGAYLWNIQFTLTDLASGDVIGTSADIFIVLNFGIDDALFDEALDYAFATVPTPGAAGMLALGGVFAARRRR